MKKYKDVPESDSEEIEMKVRPRLKRWRTGFAKALSVGPLILV